MTDAHLVGTPEAEPGPESATLSLLQALRSKSADRLDPVRFNYIEALARRTLAHQGAVRSVLDGKLTEVVTAYAKRYEDARSGLDGTTLPPPPWCRNSTTQLGRQCEAGDLNLSDEVISQTHEQTQASPLAELIRYLAQQHLLEDTTGKPEEHRKFESRSELKSIRYYRKTWSRLSVDKQVNRAIEQGPQNPGPLNSHMLVLRAMTVMRELSPDYLNRFVSYVDALLWLDQAERKTSPGPKKTGPVRARKR